MPKIKYPDQWICIRTCYCDPQDGAGRRLIKRGEVVTCSEVPNHHFEQLNDSNHAKIKAERWGATPQWVSDEDLTRRDQVFQLPDKLGLNLTVAQSENFQHAVLYLIANTTQYADLPKNDGIKYLLQKLLDACQGSMGMVTDSLKDAKKDFQSSQIYRILQLGADWPRVRDGGLDAVPDLMEAASNALAEIKKKKGGRPIDAAKKHFIDTVSKIYAEASGKVGITYNDYAINKSQHRYTGELVDLIRACFDILSIEQKSGGDVFEAIRKRKTP